MTDCLCFFYKTLNPGVCLPLPRCYIHVNDHPFSKHLQNRVANQGQIACGASMMDRENENLVGVSGKHDLYGRHAHIWQKRSHQSSWNERAHDIMACNAALGYGCTGLEIYTIITKQWQISLHCDVLSSCARIKYNCQHPVQQTFDICSGNGVRAPFILF